MVPNISRLISLSIANKEKINGEHIINSKGYKILSVFKPKREKTPNLILGKGKNNI